MRVLVCGDRKWSDRESIRRELEALKVMQVMAGQPLLVIEGEAKGADTLAREVAEELGIGVMRYPADWEAFGRAAGPMRNARMLREGQPDLVLAFHNDLEHSKGTKNMVNQARRARLPVIVISIGEGGVNIKHSEAYR